MGARAPVVRNAGGGFASVALEFVERPLLQGLGGGVAADDEREAQQAGKRDGVVEDALFQLFHGLRPLAGWPGHLPSAR